MIILAERVVKVRLSAQVQQYQAEMLKAAQVTRTVGTEAEKLAQKKAAFEQLGRAAFTAGGVMAAGITVAVKKFADFDQAMSNVAATGQDARNSIQALRDAAIEAGASTVFSATESANAIEEMAKAGVDAADILNGGLAGALDLAAAGGLGVADAAGIAAVALKTFNLEGSDMSHVADLLAAGAGKAMGDVSDLSAALAQGGQVAAATGLSIEETTAALSAFASQGLLGSDAGTSLKTMLQRLTPQSKEAADQFEALGISAYDANGQFVGLSNFAGQLKESMSGLTPEARNAALAVMFGSDAVRAANVLYSEGWRGIEQWTAAVDDQGYAAETARTKLDNLKGDVEALGGAFDSALITMGSAADGPLRFIVQGMTELVDSFNDMPAAAQQVVFGLGAVAGAGSLALGAYLMLVPKVAEFKIALDALGPSAQKAARGVGALARVGAIGATITAVTWGVDQLAEAISEKLLPSADQIANQMRSAKSGVDLFAAALTKEGITNTRQASTLLAALGDELDKVADSDFWNPASTSGTAVTVAKELASIAASGDMARFSAQFRQLAEDADLTERQLRTFIKANPELQDALTRQATEAGMAADAQSLLNIAMGEAVTPAQENTSVLKELAGQATDTGDQIEDLSDTIKGFGAANLDVRDAQREFEAALDDVQDSLEKNGDSLDISTEKGRANEAALDALAKKSLDLAAATYDQTGSQEAASDAIARGRDELIDALGQFGITGAAAEEYADQLGLIPGNISTYVEAMTDTASRAVESFISRFNGRRINVYVDANGGKTYQVQGTDVQYRASGGAIFGPGGPTSDTVPAMLSPGEHVLDADDVKAMGGQSAVYAYRKALHAQGVRKFAGGGAVVSGSELTDWRRYVRRGNARADGTGGSGLDLVDRLYDAAAAIGGKYGKRLREDAYKSEKQFTKLEREADKAATRLDKARDKLSDLKDAAAGMASRVASAVRSIFNLGDLAVSKSVTTATKGTTTTVDGVVVTSSGTTTTTQDETTAKGIASSMKATATRIKNYASKLKQLADKGLNAKLLEELAMLGVEQGEPIADALLAATKSQISDINKSYGDIDKYSNKAGKTVADENFEKLIDEARKERDDAKKNADNIQKKLEREASRIIEKITKALEKGTTVKKKAAGGPIYGPGTATSDSIPAMLSNGENVWSAAHVQAAGGQAAVERLKRMTPTAARFSNGGPVVTSSAALAAFGPATISEAAMDRLAGKVATALVQVRSADAQAAQSAVMRGVRS